ncbi:MAG: biopolymer transporter ExbD [Phycisphaera sp.]|nr:biopolymer transporter ExbD [Phycisphaera sp.]
MRQRDRQGADAGVDMAPLIDVVFILLIFFLVTATFVHDSGLTVTRPDAVAASVVESAALRVELDAAGAMSIDRRAVDVSELRTRVIAFLAANPRGAIVVVPERTTPADRLVTAIDTATAAGAKDVAIATRMVR